VSETARSFEESFIDLHSHTNESDGTLTPEELVRLAKTNGLGALAITDHDTFAGYEKAFPFAQAVELDLVRGIELNSRLYLEGNSQPRYVHVLAYFPTNEPKQQFQDWLDEQRRERRTRNRKLAASLQERGFDVSLEEVEARGRSLAGRPHFARILVDKGYARSLEDAFARYLGENAPTYVERESKTTAEVIAAVRAGGGIPVVAHPVRIGIARERERAVIARFKDAGLLGLEIFHSEHTPLLQAHYRQLAEELKLLPTGGSDFHGLVKPDIDLGTGLRGNVRVPMEVLDGLRRFVQ
jgi:predicted metal-dependent phosphoesterase TrpH